MTLEGLFQFIHKMLLLSGMIYNCNLKMNKKIKDKKSGIRVKVFVNLNGSTLLCRGRKRFLETVDRENSISAAADKLNISYRKAWEMVKKTNEAAGFTVIEAKRGGKDGGIAFLTKKGKRLLQIVEKYTEEIEELASKQTELFLEEFKED
jgi:molybdate transport repressor ModE-like protein